MCDSGESETFLPSARCFQLHPTPGATAPCRFPPLYLWNSPSRNRNGCGGEGKEPRAARGKGSDSLCVYAVGQREAANQEPRCARFPARGSIPGSAVPSIPRCRCADSAEGSGPASATQRSGAGPRGSQPSHRGIQTAPNSHSFHRALPVPPRRVRAEGWRQSGAVLAALTGFVTGRAVRFAKLKLHSVTLQNNKREQKIKCNFPRPPPPKCCFIVSKVTSRSRWERLLHHRAVTPTQPDRESSPRTLRCSPHFPLRSRSNASPPAQQTHPLRPGERWARVEASRGQSSRQQLRDPGVTPGAGTRRLAAGRAGG